MSLYSQIKSEMRLIDRAILIGIDGDPDGYAESEWEKIKRDIIALARSVDRENFARKAMNRAEKLAIKNGEDEIAAREKARFLAETEWKASHAH